MDTVARRMDTANDNWYQLKGPWVKKLKTRDFPGGTVVKNPPANAGDMGSIPGPGRSHMPRSN